jgi:DNA invertase Pin-like site-specific DNA recombinase
MIRAACYARYSSELQNATSLDDQIAVARRYAAERGWKVLKDHIYTDAALSGASIQGRAGVQRLLSAAAQVPRPFDVVLVDDSSRIARDIPDAIRVMQQLKFLEIRVIYISQGIDSESEQADALVPVHGLIDLMYLKELAKKVRRGLAGQMDRGFSTGAMQYGYDKIPVFDPSGATDPDGRPVLIGRRIQVNLDEAAVIRRIFEWAADGVGVPSIVDRLNREGIPGTGGKRWSNSPVDRILKNERYLGRQIYGQQEVEREPYTGRRIMRHRPRSEWKVIERSEMRIISDELWARTQATRKEVRERVASKNGAAGRGKSGKHHSKHLFSGFARCGECGGSITSVSGGKGSPRYGCAKSWQNGTSCCSNRLTIRIKVVEPQILAKLHEELLNPGILAYVTKAVEKEVKKALTATPKGGAALIGRLEQEKRKLQNLISALEGGASSPAAVLRAIGEREKVIGELEAQIRSSGSPNRPRTVDVSSDSVKRHLSDLAGLLKADFPRVKSEFRRLNLDLTFTPVEGEPRAHYVVKGQCDLSALVFSLVRPADRGILSARRSPGAVNHLMGANRAPARNSSPDKFTS